MAKRVCRSAAKGAASCDVSRVRARPWRRGGGDAATLGGWFEAGEAFVEEGGKVLRRPTRSSTCGDDHVFRDLKTLSAPPSQPSCVIHYIDPIGARINFGGIFHRRT
ncbi:hypothetical protein ABZ684_19810 [Streptomyces sp. NPDC006995]|uniref:hypothetical protein n=1 Tax=Streptomyces sp. NPDC006995 TaxID=3156907 RepID=UPI00340DA32F